MTITGLKKLISKELGFAVNDVFFVVTDGDMLDYYLVYRNHRIECLVSVDRLHNCVSGVYK